MLGSPLLSPAEGDGKFWWNLLADEMAETSAPLVRISQRRWRISERKSEKIKNKSIIFRLRRTGPTAFHWQWQKQSISSSADKWRLAQAQRDFSGEDLVAVQLWKVTQRVLGRRHLWLGTLSYGSKSCFCQRRSRRPSIMRPALFTWFPWQERRGFETTNNDGGNQSFRYLESNTMYARSTSDVSF